MKEQSDRGGDMPLSIVDAVGEVWRQTKSGDYDHESGWTLYRNVGSASWSISTPKGSTVRDERLDIAVMLPLADALVEVPKRMAKERIPDYQSFVEYLLDAELEYHKAATSMGRVVRSGMGVLSPDTYQAYRDTFEVHERTLAEFRCVAAGRPGWEVGDWFSRHDGRPEYRLTREQIAADPQDHVSMSDDFATLAQLHDRLRTECVPADERSGRRAAMGATTFGPTTWSWFPLALLDARGVSRETPPPSGPVPALTE